MHTLTEAHEASHFQYVLDGLLRRHRAAFMPGVLERDIVAKSFAGDGDKLIVARAGSVTRFADVRAGAAS